jgi:hypothetical protein
MRKGILHQIAHCRNCEWINENHLSARKEGKKHAKKNKHIVDVETGVWSTFGEGPENNLNT